MEYRRLGKAGLKVSELSLGAWITFGGNLDINGVRRCMHMAFDAGVNFFDNAEAYGQGSAELLMGQVLKEFPRSDIIVSTKLFWGGETPTRIGLHHKHLVEGLNNSLKRLQSEYVDLLFCHRPDPHTPIEETVRAMDILIKSGKVFYWGTSEWSAEEIATAHRLAKELNATPPMMEQPEYNLFWRDRVEKEFLPLYKEFGMGTTVWSPLAGGILTGKYTGGIPQGSRLDRFPDFKRRLTQEKAEKVQKLSTIADDIGCTLPQLAIAWCLKNPNVSTAILGVSSAQQLAHNLKATEIASKIDAAVFDKINNVVTQDVVIST